jgi:hypothetical protein
MGTGQYAATHKLSTSDIQYKGDSIDDGFPDNKYKSLAQLYAVLDSGGDG